LLAPEKSKENIFKPMKSIRDWHLEYNPQSDNRRLLTSGTNDSRMVRRAHSLPATGNFVPGGQSTQLIIGASPEDDRQILSLSESQIGRASCRERVLRLV
jgi:predicted DNA-binding helix-hairpin-helix protein